MTALVLLLALQIPDAPLARGTLSFDARATLGAFVGTTDSLRGRLQGGADLAAVTGWVEAPVATLLTGSGKRDRDLRKSLEAERFPTMRFDLARVAPGDVAGDTTTVTLHGTLTIHGVTREVALPGRVWPEAGGWRVRSDFPLNVTDYEVGGLSKLLGLLRMDEHIVVHVDVAFAP